MFTKFENSQKRDVTNSRVCQNDMALQVGTPLANSDTNTNQNVAISPVTKMQSVDSPTKSSDAKDEVKDAAVPDNGAKVNEMEGIKSDEAPISKHSPFTEEIEESQVAQNRRLRWIHRLWPGRTR